MPELATCQPVRVRWIPTSERNAMDGCTIRGLLVREGLKAPVTRRQQATNVALLGLFLSALLVYGLLALRLGVTIASRPDQSHPPQVYTPSEIRAALNAEPAMWLHKTVQIRGRIGSTCPIPPGGNVLVTGNCALPPSGAPLTWMSDNPAVTYDFQQSLAIVWSLRAPPNASHGVQGDHAGTYAVYLTLAQCPDETTSGLCAVGRVNVGR